MGERITSTGACYECSKEANRRAYAKDPERINERVKRYRSTPEGKQIRRAYGVRYYAENAEKLKSRQRGYRAVDPEGKLAVKRAWTERNADYHLNWSRQNPEACTEYRARRRARHAAADGSFTKADVVTIRTQQRDRCGYCRIGLNGRGHLDHIVALSRGGSNWPRNLQLLCQPCNQRKKDRDPLEFARSLGRLM